MATRRQTRGLWVSQPTAFCCALQICEAEPRKRKRVNKETRSNIQNVENVKKAEQKNKGVQIRRY